MEFFGNIIKGIMIGIANIIPGVSGGTMAVSLGIYDRLIGSISGLFREFKKSILFLIPIIIGDGIGIVGFTSPSNTCSISIPSLPVWHLWA